MRFSFTIGNGMPVHVIVVALADMTIISLSVVDDPIKNKKTDSDIQSRFARLYVLHEFK